MSCFYVISKPQQQRKKLGQNQYKYAGVQTVDLSIITNKKAKK